MCRAHAPLPSSNVYVHRAAVVSLRTLLAAGLLNYVSVFHQLMSVELQAQGDLTCASAHAASPNGQAAVVS